jgi:inner membrane protein
MATIVTHAVVGAALAKACPGLGTGWRFCALATLLAAMPDFDALGFRFGIQYGDLWGHRGITHSLAFALLVSLLAVVLFYRKVPRFSRGWWLIWAVLAAMPLSHLIVDMFTDATYGVALLAPFSAERFWFAWRPIPAAHMRLRTFFSNGGLGVLAFEALWLWLPAAVPASAAWFIRRRRRASLAGGSDPTLPRRAQNNTGRAQRIER